MYNRLTSSFEFWRVNTTTKSAVVVPFVIVSIGVRYVVSMWSVCGQYVVSRLAVWSRCDRKVMWAQSDVVTT